MTFTIRFHRKRIFFLLMKKRLVHAIWSNTSVKNKEISIFGSNSGSGGGVKMEENHYLTTGTKKRGVLNKTKNHNFPPN